jgi:hypothetical protein
MKISKNFRVGSPIGSQFAGLDQRRVSNYSGQERPVAQKVDQIFGRLYSRLLPLRASLIELQKEPIQVDNE